MSVSSDAVSPPTLDLPRETPAGISAARAAEPVIPPGEFVRKALHMSPGLAAYAMSFIPHYDPLAWHEVGIVAGLAVLLTVIYLVLHRTVRRGDEDNFLSTVFSYGFCCVTMAALFRAQPEFTCVVVAVLAFGDGSAYFGGKLFGRKKLPWNRKKSWIGSMCFVLVSAPLAALAFWLEARPASVFALIGACATVHPDLDNIQRLVAAPYALAMICATAAAVAGAIAESLPTRLTDNLRVGIAAGAACAATYFAVLPWFS